MLALHHASYRIAAAPTALPVAAVALRRLSLSSRPLATLQLRRAFAAAARTEARVDRAGATASTQAGGWSAGRPLDVTESTEGFPETAQDAEQEMQRLAELDRIRRETFPQRFIVTEGAVEGPEMAVSSEHVVATDEWLAAHERDVKNMQQERQRRREAWMRDHPLSFSESALGDLETPKDAEIELKAGEEQHHRFDNMRRDHLKHIHASESSIGDIETDELLDAKLGELDSDRFRRIRELHDTLEHELMMESKRMSQDEAAGATAQAETRRERVGRYSRMMERLRDMIPAGREEAPVGATAQAGGVSGEQRVASVREALRGPIIDPVGDCLLQYLKDKHPEVRVSDLRVPQKLVDTSALPGGFSARSTMRTASGQEVPVTLSATFDRPAHRYWLDVEAPAFRDRVCLLDTQAAGGPPTVGAQLQELPTKVDSILNRLAETQGGHSGSARQSQRNA